MRTDHLFIAVQYTINDFDYLTSPGTNHLSTEITFKHAFKIQTGSMMKDKF